MKKVVINLILVLLVFVCFFLQSNLFSWFNIAGITPNLFVILIVFIGLFANKYMGAIYGVVVGFFIDYIFRSKVGIMPIALGLVGIFSKIFDKNFSKDSRITIMMIVGIMTVLFETISYFIGVMVFTFDIQIWQFIKILLVEVVFNILLVVILYPLIVRFGYYIENEYRENKILTRYF